MRVDARADGCFRILPDGRLVARASSVRRTGDDAVMSPDLIPAYVAAALLFAWTFVALFAMGAAAVMFL